MDDVPLIFPISQAAVAEKITDWADKSTGEFRRGQSQFRSRISNKPNAEFPAEKGRYHLYVSYACPWGKSHRSKALISYFAKLIKLSEL
jgi:glutathionyl-hydroquinone reductase